MWTIKLWIAGTVLAAIFWGAQAGIHLPDCNAPDAPANGAIKDVKGKYKLQAVVKFVCDPGFKLKGKSTTKCDVDSELYPIWTEKTPKCVPAATDQPLGLESNDVKQWLQTNDNNICLGCDELMPIIRAQLNLTNQILRELDEIRNNPPSCKPSVDGSTNPPPPTYRPRDCKEVQTAGFKASGRYAIYLDGSEDPVFVFCDMETDGGGWTVFQRRQDGSVDFYLNWTHYKNGFGSVEGEHWLGNENIHRLTSQKTYELRIDLEDFEEKTRYAVYDRFRLSDENLHYKLILGAYKGDAGDSLTTQAGMAFTTKDRDFDAYPTNCAELYHGAWWYNVCHYSNLNGDYLSGTTSSYGTGINWFNWKGFNYSLKKTEMKIRPIE